MKKTTIFALIAITIVLIASIVFVSANYLNNNEECPCGCKGECNGDCNNPECTCQNKCETCQGNCNGNCQAKTCGCKT